MKKLDASVPWSCNWSSYRAVDKSGKVYEYDAKPMYIEESGEWHVDSSEDIRTYFFVGDKYEFTPNYEVRMVDYHALPCGTRIPPEGVMAWVKGGDDWYNWSTEPKTIVAYANSKCITIDCGNLIYYNKYSLTDPNVKPEPKKRKITANELYGKCLHIRVDDSKDLCMMVIGFDNEIVYTRHSTLTIEGIDKHCKGYSDTPTSELKPFWVEET